MSDFFIFFDGKEVDLIFILLKFFRIFNVYISLGRFFNAYIVIWFYLLVFVNSKLD